LREHQQVPIRQYKLNPVKNLMGLKRPQINCPCCGAAMRIVQTRIPASSAFGLLASSG